MMKRIYRLTALISFCSYAFTTTTFSQCATPTGLTVNSVTDVNASISFTSSETAFDYEIGPAGFVQGAILPTYFLLPVTLS